MAWRLAGSRFASSIQPGGLSFAQTVNYIATGGEGLHFAVPFGIPTSGTGYAVFWTPNGVTDVPILDLPTAGRTTAHFFVDIAVPLAAGDKLTFLVVS